LTCPAIQLPPMTATSAMTTAILAMVKAVDPDGMDGMAGLREIRANDL
jgi:hypothetical protein